MNRDIPLVGKYAAALSLVELALGSLLHSLQVPFAGVFLSLNQGFLLCRSALEAKQAGASRLVAYKVSNVSAVLKSLSPAGKKLGPMLSLSMQGLLFTIGVGILGVNLLGLMAGMVLLSLWSFVQPLVTYYLFFGNELFAALKYFFEKTIPFTGLGWQELSWILAALVAAKMLAAGALGFLAWRGWGQEFQDRLLKVAKEKGLRPLDAKTGEPGTARGSAIWLAVTDLFRPIFVLSLSVTALFLGFSQHGMGEKVWILLRPLAIGFLFFYISRSLTLDRWLNKLQGTRGEGFARACQSALGYLRGERVPELKN